MDLRQPQFLYVYVLKLSNSKYYVGCTDSIDSRLKEHKRGVRSCSWVQSNLPIINLTLYTSNTAFDEDNITKTLMSEHGIENVRGGSYTRDVLGEEEVSLISKELATLCNKCFLCGDKGHYAKACPAKAVSKLCSRCHRGGHTANRCYAKTTIDGAPLANAKTPASVAKATYIKFYEKRDPYYIFSNFAPCQVTYKGTQYPTSEHAYQCQKFLGPTATPKFIEYAEVMRATENVNKLFILSKQKRVGGYKWKTDLNPAIEKYQDVIIRQDWDDVKDDIMSDIVYIKFAQNEKARKELLSTGDAVLQENSPRDSYWGIGKDGTGQNKLGIVLMNVRSKLG